MYGIIAGFGGPIDAIPNGWKPCDGRRLNAEAFAEAFQAIGNVWGPGNPAGEFQLPDLSGQFLRGVDEDGVVDPDVDTREPPDGGAEPLVGSWQRDAMQGHAHEVAGYYHSSGGGGGGGSLGAFRSGALDVSGPVEESSAFGPPRTSSETRPVNVAVHWIIYVGSPSGVDQTGVPVEWLPDGRVLDARGRAV